MVLRVNDKEIKSVLCSEQCPIYLKDANPTTLVMQASDLVFEAYISSVITEEKVFYLLETLSLNVAIILTNSVSLLQTEYQFLVQMER